jgi:branched-subunit amino acid ABC-type transport system permease component
MHVLNFAHGAFFMVGAFVAYSASVSWRTGSSVIVPLLAAIAICCAVGFIAERTVYRRLYHFSHLQALLGTFALFLVMASIAQQVWGVYPLGIAIPRSLSGHLSVFGVGILWYQIFTIAASALVMIGLQLWLRNTRVGLQVRAVAANRDMASALGIKAERVFWIMFTVGCGLAGLAGALIAPLVSITTDLGSDYIVLAFAVVLIGGLGSLGGAVIASLLLGFVDSFASVFLPQVAPYAVFLTLILFLTLRPFGLFGSAAARIEL